MKNISLFKNSLKNDLCTVYIDNDFKIEPVPVCNLSFVLHKMHDEFGDVQLPFDKNLIATFLKRYKIANKDICITKDEALELGLQKGKDKEVYYQASIEYNKICKKYGIVNSHTNFFDDSSTEYLLDTKDKNWWGKSSIGINLLDLDINDISHIEKSIKFISNPNIKEPVIEFDNNIYKLHPLAEIVDPLIFNKIGKNNWVILMGETSLPHIPLLDSVDFVIEGGVNNEDNEDYEDNKDVNSKEINIKDNNEGNENNDEGIIKDIGSITNIFNNLSEENLINAFDFTDNIISV